MAKPHRMPASQKPSPLNKKKHKNRDPARLNIRSTIGANQTRKNLMSDGVDCSVWMPFGQFMRKYLHSGGDFPEKMAGKVREAFLKKLKLDQLDSASAAERIQDLKEKDWSQAWLTVAQDTTLPTKLCPGFVLHLSEDTPSSDSSMKMRIDASLICEDEKNRIKPKQPNWNLQRLPIEFKRSGSGYDPFDDDPRHKHESSADDRRGVYGQLMTYAERIFVNQHRKHLFLLFINGPKFRVMFFDHSGVLATESVDYISTVDGTAALLAFLHAFYELDDVQQGIDTSVIPLLPTSCGYQRMDVLKEAQDGDLDYHARYVNSNEFSRIPPSFLSPSDPEAVVDTEDSCIHADPTHVCEGHERDAAILPVFTYVRDAFRRAVEPGQARFMVKVGQRHYLIGRYANDPPTSLVGRGTKGYVALEWETQRFVFLKDTWRSYYVDIEREGDILRELNDKGVRNVPTVIAHGDVEEQETETSKYSPITGQEKVEICPPYLEGVKARKDAERLAKTVKGRMKPNPKNVAASTSQASTTGSKNGRGKKRSAGERTAEETSQQGQGLRHMIHYRLVIKEICLALTEFSNSGQLINIITDCVIAHEMAYKKCCLIHRDVSFGNVLILPRLQEMDNGRYAVVWRGLLADWELAKDYRIMRALQPERTGTWHFMSWYILMYPDQPVTIPDELEAFVHVLIYAAIRLVDHNFAKIKGFVNSYFDGCTESQDGYGCPSGKVACVREGKLVTSDALTELLFCSANVEPTKHPLNALVCELLSLLRTRYIVFAYKNQLAAQAKPSRTASAPSPPPDDMPILYFTIQPGKGVTRDTVDKIRDSGGPGRYA